MKYLIFIGLLLSINHAQYNWEDDGSPIRQGLHIEWQRTGDADSDGSIIYAWSDCRNGVRDVVAQKVDKNGNNLWGDNGVVVVNAEGRQEDPQLVIDGNGGAYVIWMDYRNESDSEGDIYAQHIDDNGNMEWGDEGIAIVDQEGKQASPNICSDGNDGAYVIWKDNAQSSYGDIYATHLSNSGVIQSGLGVPIITYQSYRSSPSLNTAGSGKAILVWDDDRNSNLDLYAERISIGNDTINTEWGNEGGKLICNASGDQTSPRVSQYDGDYAIVTWEDERNDDTDAYYQILDGNGDGQLDENGVIACAGDWEIIKPRVKAENSIAYIVWEDRRNDWTSDIYAQKINSSGNVVWSNGMVISNSSGSQTEPRLDTDGNGGVYFVWEDQRNSSLSGIDIYAQHVDNDDNMTHDDNGELICDADNLQFNPLVRNDGSGGAIILWGDQRTGGSYGINMQNLTSSGITLEQNGKETFFGISTDAANEPYEHGMLYLGGSSLVYWQDNRWGSSKIYGSLIESTFDVSSEIFENDDINGEPLVTLDLAQENPRAILVEDKVFLSFKVEESPNENLYFQFLNKQTLGQIGSAIPISDPATSKQGFKMTYGNDGFIYYAFSEEYDITIKKISSTGTEEWSISAVQSSADDIISSIYPLPNTGCMIIYESQSWQTGSQLYALEIDGQGNLQNGGPILLSNSGGDQYFEGSTMVNNGIFISFKTNTSGNYDIYGQHLLFDGNLNFGSSGIAITENSNTQEKSSITYNELLNEVFCCYESSLSSETDIYCNKIQLSNQSISGAMEISSNSGNQGNPHTFWSGGSYLITWEDARNSSDSDVDIYFQELLDDAFIFSDGGDPLCTFDLKQERPIISQYNSSSFIIIWEDYRSTGKEFCANLYGQTYSSGSGCPNLGDMNGDDTWNVLDIVALANCVLASNCGDLDNGCAGDMNGDDTWNVLDIVALANCVLASACDEI